MRNATKQFFLRCFCCRRPSVSQDKPGNSWRISTVSRKQEEQETQANSISYDEPVIHDERPL